MLIPAASKPLPFCYSNARCYCTTASVRRHHRDCDWVALGHLHNAIAIVTSPLRPTGKIEIDGTEYSARSEDGSYVASETEVTICGNAGTVLIVNNFRIIRAEQ